MDKEIAEFSRLKEYFSAVAKPLLLWYDANARVLPWREHPVPYYVWVSEIMLQQTRVEAVKPYFDRFITRLPTLSSLAQAEDDLLLKLWEGLGYYNRVRNLKKAARVVVEQYGGELPPSFEHLLALPGIGRYTAGAIASIAYGIPVPAVDGNVLRVVCRVLTLEEDISKDSTKRAVESLLHSSMPSFRAGAYNQALMELGATVCLPNGAPKCDVCPLCKLCRAHELSCVSAYPVKAPKKERTQEDKTVFILMGHGKIALRRRPSTGLLAGMWELPSVEGHLSSQQAGLILEKWETPCRVLYRLPDAVHIFTHREWHMIGYSGTVSSPPQDNSQLQWFSLEALDGSIALPSAFKAYRVLLRELAGKLQPGQAGNN